MLDLPKLPAAARLAHIIPGLATHSLISTTKLCNAGCEVKFTKIGCFVTYNGRTVLCGRKCTRTGLWMVPLSESTPTLPTNETSNYLSHYNEMASNLQTCNTKAELAQYIHQCLCSPPKATLLKAINNGQLSSFPGLTYDLINKHLPPSTATDKGHMHRTRQGVQSTRNNITAIRDARTEVDNMSPNEEICNTQHMFCYAALADTKTGTMYTDLTGQFPVRSYKNMVYIFVAYIYDINAIISVPMPSRNDNAMITAFETVLDQLKVKGYHPTLNIMDNECSKAVEAYIRKEKIAIQLVPPHNHRVNAAERAIATFKDHFVAALATLDINCPLQLWDEFIFQVQATLNMLRTSRRNETVSAYEELCGPFDFNKTPLAPLGTKALTFDDPELRTAFAPHGTDGYYVGPAMKHYRCLRFFIPTTRNFRTTDTYRLYPTHSRIPTITTADETFITAKEMLQAFKTQLSPTATRRVAHAQVLQDLTNIITNAPSPRVHATAEQRVNVPSTSHDATSPRVIRGTTQIHQRHTRSNTPMPVIMEEIEPPSSDDDDATVIASNRENDILPPAPMPVLTKQTTKKRRVNGVTIGSKRNKAKNISRKRLQNLLDSQTVIDKTTVITQLERTATIPKEPTAFQESLISYHVPTPKGAPDHGSFMPITQDDEDITNMPMPQPRRSQRLQATPKFQNVGPANISQEALYHVAGLGYTNAPLYSVPTSLMKEKLTISPAIDIEEMCNGVVHPITNETITKYQKLINEPLLRETWTKAMCIELGRLAQGFEYTKGTNTIRFLNHREIKEIPGDRTVTYARIVVDYRPQKEDPNRVRITVGGNLIDYPYELTTRTVELTTSKILWNSVISTPNAKYITADAKNFYLETPMERFEYMRMPIKLIPQEIIDLYDLEPKVKNGHVYMEISRGMYGLPQSSRLANQLLKKRLLKHGYFEQPHTPGLFKHVSRPVWFTLAVDDFGIKYIGEDNARHLLAALEEDYTLDVDWEGSLYCGISLSWDYKNRTVDLSMPKYVHKQLLKYKHTTPKRKQNCPYSPNPIKYGAKIQAPTAPDESPPLSKEDHKYIQQVVGSFLFYARAIDNTILMALSAIAGDQAAPTENTMKRVKQFLDYMATNPHAIIRYKASDMVLNIHSDASYLSAPKARSRAGGYFFLGSMPVDKEPIFLNGAVHINCTILKLVAASAAEAELGALFLNAQDAKILRITLAELGHPQPSTPIHIDNTTTVGIVNSTIKRQRSRAMEMRYFWLLDNEAQSQFAFHQHPGLENLGDYPSKHHFGEGHVHVRPYYVHMHNSPTHLIRAPQPASWRGCVGTLGDPYLRKTPLPRLPISRKPIIRSRIQMRTPILADTTQTHIRSHHLNGHATQPRYPQIMTQ